MNDTDEFFRKMEDYQVISRFYGNQRCFSVEELYQHFKNRLINDLLVESPELLDMPHLVDTE